MSEATVREQSQSLVSRRAVLAGIGVVAGISALGLDFVHPASAAAGGWGGYKNGEIPLSVLSPVAGYYFRTDAANALVSMRTAFQSARGHALVINDGYRDLAGQQAAWDLYGSPRAAYPGTSNHGWALAADFGGDAYSQGTADHNWLRANSEAFGWWWAGQFLPMIEPWHWEYNGTYLPPAPPIPPVPPEDEDVMIQPIPSRVIRNSVSGDIAILHAGGVALIGDPLIPDIASASGAGFLAGQPQLPNGYYWIDLPSDRFGWEIARHQQLLAAFDAHIKSVLTGA